MGAGLLAALVGLTGPIVARALVALGFSVVTITGVTLVISTLKSSVLSNFGAAPLAALQLIGLGGGWIALGLLFGAMTFCVSFWTLTSAQRILGKA
jgi:hypothetical protein